jgi:AAA+ ATPase superfamily predicted ATPase
MLQFYNRIKELAELKRIGDLSFKDHSRMTVLTGRRRIGKTLLAMKAIADAPAIYLFVGRKNEASLCDEFTGEVSRALNVFVPEEISSFRSLFQYLMELARQRPFHLVIDEFQEFLTVNESIYSDIQHIWDLYKDTSKMNLILSGSLYALMQRIFMDAGEPLFGRADTIIKLSPFDLKTIKEIMGNHRPQFSNDELLALYTFTGGIPKYLELFCDNTSLSINGMIDFMVRDNSPFIEEGKYLLIEEFGKNYGMYFSILSAISGGITTQHGIEAAVGDKSIGGHIKRLIEDYNILVRRRPVMAKEGTQAVRYEIIDNFLQFWFNYFDRYRSLIEIKNFTGLKALVKADYPVYSGRMLERYFRQQFAESGKYRIIGSWWTPKGGAVEQNEIDMVALKLKKKQALAVEVKRQKKHFRSALLETKAEHLKHKVLPDYDIACLCLTLEDM